MNMMQAMFKLSLILTLLLGPAVSSYQVSHSPCAVSQLSVNQYSSEHYSAQCPVSQCYSWLLVDCGGEAQWGDQAGTSEVRVGGGVIVIREENFFIKSENIDHNFLARYQYGNIIQRRKGILNMHLNIRSLRYKMHEVKQVVKQNNPNILGISECEIKKETVDEKSLKVPGYDILFPKSWEEHGHARVVVYVKKTFKYQQVPELQDDKVQSVWIKGGQRNCKEIFFCHVYREHLTGQGSAAQCRYMNTLLGQWEAATEYGGRGEPNETHICGDMNIDTYQGRWLENNYHLVNLSRLVKQVCDVNNFHQLVNGITRLQYNSVTNTTDISCIDHIYTNAKYRCSEPSIISFGDSDHDLIGYLRYSKNPPVPARIICKRSYRNFDTKKFQSDVSNTDWSEVYACDDVDQATECFTRKFRFILNEHAPWVRVQQRKTFSPWVSTETKDLMKQRDLCKQRAKDLALSSPVACQAQRDAWSEYKTLRNEINNRKKYEEQHFKSEKMAEVAESPDLVWKSAKSFMGWKSTGTPNQLNVGNRLVTSAKQISQAMNEFFIQKVQTIREGLAVVPFAMEKVQDIMVNKQCKMKISHVTLLKVKKVLKSLTNSRSTGIDELDNYSVKLAAEYIAQPVHHIVSLSIMQNKFPQVWKFSKSILKFFHF